MSLGYRIKTLRGELQMSQKALAKKAGISQATISDYENDIITEHRAHILLKLAAALETTPDYLMTGKGDKSIGAISTTRKELISLVDQLTPDAQAALLLAAKAMIRHP